MKRKMALLFCAVMSAAVLVGMFPATTASAETITAKETVRFVEEVSEGVYTYTDEVVATEHTSHREFSDRLEIPMPVSTMSLDVDEDGDLIFTTFEDLQELAAQTYSEPTVAYYAGEEPLEIGTDLTLPDRLGIWVMGNTLQVPAGVTLSCGGNTYLYADMVVVDGTLISAYLDVSEALIVSGTLYNNDRIYLKGGAEIAGASNIVYNLSGSRLLWWYSIADMADLNTAAAAAYNAPDDNWVYEVVFDWTDIQISESMTLPSNCEVRIEKAVTVATGCTLDLKGYTWVYGPLTVQGTLNNGDVVDIFYDHGGTMTIADGGSYTGSGALFVNSETLPDPSDGVPGLNLSDFVTDEYNDEYGHYWELTYAPESPALAAPASLSWGFDYLSDNQAPGFISWQASAQDHGKAIVRVYRDGALYETYGWAFEPATGPQWRSIDSFCNSDPETGTYRFTVTSMADSGSGYRRSQTVSSENWYYEKPAAQLGACTNLSWQGSGMYFDEPADMTYVDGYEIQMFYGSTPTAEPVCIATMWGRYSSDMEYSAGQAAGAGYYYFKVRSLSSDITKVCNGPWSELSEAYHLTEEDAARLELPFTEREWEVLRLVNLERYNAGVEPLAGFTALQQAAEIRAVELQQLFEHTRPDGSSFSTVLAEVGIDCGYAGENAAQGYGSPAGVMNGWMNSTGHRENILRPGYTQIGIGNYGYNWIQLFLGGDTYTSLDVVLPKSTYDQGTTLDEMDIIAVLHSNKYGDCYMPLLSQYCTGFDPYQIGKQTVTVSVRGLTKTFEVTIQIKTTPMYRLYNPNSGEHFYTGSEEERDKLQSVGWNYEGVAWNAPVYIGKPVYRMFNPNSGDHHYTMSLEEKENLQNIGWQYEGVAWNSAPADHEESVPQYRLYNPNADLGCHHYTSSLEERRTLEDKGWNFEGIGWFGLLR